VSKNLTGSNSYWTCVGDVLDHVSPPQPTDFLNDLEPLNAIYEKLGCYAFITYDTYVSDKYFRELANSWVDYQAEDVQALIESNSTIDQSDSYWKCVKTALSQQVVLKQVTIFP